MKDSAGSAVEFERLAIFGVGLLGGSLGLACRRAGLAREIIGVGRDERRLAVAQGLGAIDRFTTDAAGGFSEADLIVLAAPVRIIIDILPRVRDHAPAGVLVTDVGSAKASIVRQAEDALSGSAVDFVGSHPMAGSEQTGVANARDDLYQGAICYLTPTTGSSEQAVDRLERFWERLGARTVRMAPEAHDRMVAMLSHLPHAVAVALVEALEAVGEGRGQMRTLAGPGVLDTTRVAAGSTDMWRDIFIENRTETLAAIDRFSASLGRLREAIEARDVPAIETILDRARNLRQFLGGPEEDVESDPS